MTKAETKKVLAVLASNYKSIRETLEDASMAEITVNTWYSCLADIEYKLCGKAVQKCIITNKFPPTIHDIRLAILEMTNPKQIDATEYWQIALKMAQNGNYMKQEEYEQYPEVCKRFFGGLRNMPMYGSMDTQDMINNIQPRFLRYVENYQKEEKENLLLPQSYKDMVAKLADKMQIREIG